MDLITLVRENIKYKIITLSLISRCNNFIVINKIIIFNSENLKKEQALFNL